MRSLRSLLPALGAWALGIVIVFHATLLSGFALVEGDVLDSRFNLYILEHSWLWLTGASAHAHFWNAPFYFPTANVTAYSDTLVTVAPVYWLLRAVGVGPSTALQWWLPAMATLNFVAAYVLLRRALHVRPIAAAAGAFLFAFANARTAQMGHPQMQPQFYSIIALYALVRAFEESHAGRPARWWLAAFAGAAAAQCWAGFYYAFFLAFGLVIAALGALVHPAYRASLITLVRRNAPALVASVAAAALLVAPLAVHYVAVAGALGERHYAALAEFMPTPASWVYMGSGNWLYDTLWHGHAFDFRMPQEQQLGLGLVTTVLALWGLVSARTRPLVALSLTTAAVIIGCATVFPGGHTAWPLVFEWMPGARALRAVSRIGLMLLIPGAIGIAWFVERAAASGWRTAATLATAVIALEQVQTLQVYDKADVRAAGARITALIPPSCTTVLYAPRHARHMTWQYQVDGMWAGLERGMPTINGYSGNAPPDWDFRQIRINDAANDSDVTAALRVWRAKWGNTLGRVCVVSPDLAHVREPQDFLESSRPQ